MTWLAWRQFRPQALTGAGLTVALAAWIVWLGLRIHAFEDRVLSCSATTCDAVRRDFIETFARSVDITGAIALAVPAVIGIFWGAPLIARELENGTHRLVWTQGVSRTRWLAVKLAIVAVAAAIVGALLAVLLSWAAEPFDALVGSRFGAMTFGARGIVLLGYAVFAFILGMTTGLLLRRTLPAMAVTLVLLVAVQLAMPLLVRQHLIAPVERSVSLEQAVSEGEIDSLGMSEDGPDVPVEIGGYNLPGVWMLSGRTALEHADGTVVTAAELHGCQTGTMAGDLTCLDEEAGGVHFDVTYHPADRYWPFQGIETGILLALGAALAGLAFRRMPRAAG